MSDEGKGGGNDSRVIVITHGSGGGLPGSSVEPMRVGGEPFVWTPPADWGGTLKIETIGHGGGATTTFVTVEPGDTIKERATNAVEERRGTSYEKPSDPVAQ